MENVTELADSNRPAVGTVLIRLCGWGEAEMPAMRVREQVFIVEQNVPAELERDEYDEISRHALAYAPDGKVVGTGRLLPDAHVGRLAVLPPFRGTGVGSQILEALIAEARAGGFKEVILNAQLQAQGFYARYGFIPEGESFLDAGIEHRRMRRRF